jgi:hypothetical protein
MSPPETAQAESAPSIELHDTSEDHSTETHPIDVVITNFDNAVNQLRVHCEALKDSTTTKSIRDCLASLVAMQGFMREVRKLFGDLL